MIGTLKLYKLSRRLFTKGWRRWSQKIDSLNKVINKCVLHGETSIGTGTSLGYGGIGVVVHKNSVIGDNCTISQNVTIGRKKGKNGGVPVLGNNVYVGANSVIFGDISIGNNCIIGPCSLVNRSIPSNSVVVGNPCRVIKTISSENFEFFADYNIDYEQL